ncbi:Ribosomal-protein-alanine N-acetyltransferase [Halorhabdus sp. SVX81]|uniref:ribosomal protein S18-alanine N-acetyltransferase n=1 Tax=Halorhabdus sp. SVX81 TaxID=2978283 RepID=UPI0023DB16B5|nr:ribosomal protein S18-alanine N-acetyltransferase [Halorhabdus sp. SVX81]WEL16409.1 Ribosomal-protein-alanine N-acetyltransferase [Halorhabdus sp. SVX81]
MYQGLVESAVTTVASERAAGPLVRPATDADLYAVAEIERRSFSQPWPIGAFERFLDAPAFLVAVDRAPGTAGSVIGYVVADMVPNHSQPLGHVKDLAVHPDRRNGGVGRQLLQRAIIALGAGGITTVKLEVRESNDTARHLYRSEGFVHRRTIPGYYDDGEHALVMFRSP